MTDLVQAVENNLAVAGKVLPTVHTAVWDELTNDWQNHRGSMIAKGVLATAAGVGMGMLCSRAPVFGRQLMLSLGGIELARLGNSGIRLIDMAAHANTEQDREMIAGIARQSIGREGALLLETLPGGFLGGKAGAELGRHYGLGRSLASWGQGVEAWQRKMFGDMVAYRGPGSGTVSAAGDNGGVDLLKLGGEVNNAFTGTRTTFGGRPLEQARVWKIGAEGSGDVRVGHTVMGRVRADGVSSGQELSFGRYADNVSHTHLNGDVRLSTGDFNAVKKGGLVVAHADDGAVMVFGNGKGGTGNANSMWDSLVTQPGENLALRVTSRWNPQVGLEPIAVQPVQWTAAEAMLRSYRGGPLNLSSLPLAPHLTAQSSAARALMNRIMANVAALP